jgi:hypothetical protein
VTEPPWTESDRPRFVVARVAENGRLDFDRLRALAETLLGRPLTTAEEAEQRARWCQRNMADSDVGDGGA